MNVGKTNRCQIKFINNLVIRSTCPQKNSMGAFTKITRLSVSYKPRNIFSKSFTINHLNDESRHEVTRLFAYADNKKNQLTKHQHPFSPPRFQVLNTSRISTKYSQQCGFASNMVSMVRACNRMYIESSFPRNGLTTSFQS